MAGRPPKPAKMRIYDGTHKDCVHGPKEAILDPGGQPVMPECVRTDAVAADFWSRNVPLLVKIGVATAADQDALEDLAMSYSLMVQTRELCQIDPTDKESRIAYSAYTKQWEGMAKEFGMTPVARNKIKAEHTSMDDLEAKFG